LKNLDLWARIKYQNREDNHAPNQDETLQFYSKNCEYDLSIIMGKTTNATGNPKDAANPEKI
jgi:hypothetical protein